MSRSQNPTRTPENNHPSGYCVALTGGIASGKTTASDYFIELGVPVIDTDCIARRLVQPGSPALQKIAEELGSEYIDSDKKLDRKKLRTAIFTDSDIKSRLESILHPLIFKKVLHQAREVDSDYFILVVPLLAESKNYDWVDRVLLIDISVEQQIARVMARDKISLKEAEEILAAQSSRAERMKLADDVLPNQGSRENLKNLVEQLHEKYQKLARTKSP